MTAVVDDAPLTPLGATPSSDATSARTRARFWAGMAAPGTIWLIALYVVPAYAILAVAFGDIDPILRTAAPAWNPMAWDTSPMTNVLGRVFGGNLGHVFVRTGLYAFAALTGCCLIGYPVAYYVARVAHRSQIGRAHV